MKILAALDDSNYAFKALRRAIDIAKKECAALTIYSVFPIIMELGEISFNYQEPLAMRAEEIVVKGKALAEQEGVFVETEIEYGYSPADNIVRYAESN